MQDIYNEENISMLFLWLYANVLLVCEIQIYGMPVYDPLPNLCDGWSIWDFSARLCLCEFFARS